MSVPTRLVVGSQGAAWLTLAAFAARHGRWLSAGCFLAAYGVFALVFWHGWREAARSPQGPIRAERVRFAPLLTILGAAALPSGVLWHRGRVDGRRVGVLARRVRLPEEFAGVRVSDRLIVAPE